MYGLPFFPLMQHPTLIHYLEIWGLSDPAPLAKTPTSTLYTVMATDQRAVLKLLTPLGQQDEAAGTLALQHFDGFGAVRLMRADAQAHLLEYASGQDLIPLVEQGQDSAATHIIADVVAQLHTPKPNPPPVGLIPLERRFASLLKNASSLENPIFYRGATVAQKLLATPCDVRVLHGDLHHANIRHHPTRGWLAFDPKGLIGERTFDLANSLCNPVHMPQHVMAEGRLLAQAKILAHTLNLGLERLLAYTFAYACLSAVWSIEDAQDPTLAIQIANHLAQHIAPRFLH